VFVVRIRSEAQVRAKGGSQLGWFNVWDRVGSQQPDVQRGWNSVLKLEISERDDMPLPLLPSLSGLPPREATANIIRTYRYDFN